MSLSSGLKSDRILLYVLLISQTAKIARLENSEKITYKGMKMSQLNLQL